MFNPQTQGAVAGLARPGSMRSRGCAQERSRQGAATIHLQPGRDHPGGRAPLPEPDVGYGAGELTGQPTAWLCPKGWAELRPTISQFWQPPAPGRRSLGIFERVNQQGRRRWLETSYFPVRQQGRVTRVVKLASDVTRDTRSCSTWRRSPRRWTAPGP